MRMPNRVSKNNNSLINKSIMCLVYTQASYNNNNFFVSPDMIFNIKCRTVGLAQSEASIPYSRQVISHHWSSLIFTWSGRPSDIFSQEETILNSRPIFSAVSIPEQVFIIRIELSQKSRIFNKILNSNFFSRVNIKSNSW